MFGKNFILQFEPTTCCNIDCNICMRRNLDREAGSASFETFKRVLGSRNFTYVGFHGWGEPLLNKEIFEMVGYTVSKRIYTSLITNGSLLHKRLDDVFSSKLDELVFGIYNLKRLDEIKENIETLIDEKNKFGSNKPEIFFDITAYDGNRDEICELIATAGEIGVKNVNIHRLFNVYGVDSGAEPLSPPAEKELFKNVKRVSKKSKIKVILPKKHETPCRIIKYCLFITWDGYLTPCCFLPMESFGNVLKSNVNDILRSKAYKSFLKGMKDHEICKKCIM